MTSRVFKPGDRVVLKWNNRSRTSERPKDSQCVGTLLRDYGGGYQAWWVKWDGWNHEDAQYEDYLEPFEFQYDPNNQNDLEEDI